MTRKENEKNEKMFLGKNNHGKEYDRYYSGDESTYYKLYKDNIISRDRNIITEIALKCAMKVKSLPDGRKALKILDYGCGDGRYLQAIINIAKFLENKGIEVELIGYDPSKTGLEKFEEKLQKASFQKVAENGYHYIAEDEGGTKSYVGNTFKNEAANLTVKLIHGHVDDKLDHIASLIGNVDLTLCLFGVLSHVPGRQNRIKLLDMFGDITSEGKVIVTLPGYRILSKQHEVFNYLRKEHYSKERLAHAQEDGDLYYTRYIQEKNGTTKQIENFYHIYQSSKEVLFDLAAAKLHPANGIQVQKILSEATLTQNPLLSVLDEWVSWVVPLCLQDYVAGYYLAVAERPKELKKMPGKFETQALAAQELDRTFRTISKL